jgi:hypothetical protein
MNSNGKRLSNPCYYCTSSKYSGCKDECCAYQEYIEWLEQYRVRKPKKGGTKDGYSKA